jgi:hypothetical protein
VQVDPVKPTLKAPGTKLLNLKYAEPLSNHAFRFKLRRYNKGALTDGTEFDSSYGRGKPITFAPKQVIKGWTEAMQKMREVGSQVSQEGQTFSRVLALAASSAMFQTAVYCIESDVQS